LLAAGKKAEQREDRDKKKQEGHARADEQAFFLLLFRLLEHLLRFFGARSQLAGILRRGGGFGGGHHGGNPGPIGLPGSEGLRHRRGDAAILREGEHGFGEIFDLGRLVGRGRGGRGGIDHAGPQRGVQDQVRGSHATAGQTVLSEVRGDIRRGAKS
jgi:hypothetical protein